LIEWQKYVENLGVMNLPEPKLSLVEQAAPSPNRPIAKLLSDIVLAALLPIDDVPDEMK